MDTEKYSLGPCPIGRGLAKVSDGWSMAIAYWLLIGRLRARASVAR